MRQSEIETCEPVTEVHHEKNRLKYLLLRAFRATSLPVRTGVVTWLLAQTRWRIARRLHHNGRQIAAGGCPTWNCPDEQYNFTTISNLYGCRFAGDLSG